VKFIDLSLQINPHKEKGKKVQNYYFSQNLLPLNAKKLKNNFFGLEEVMNHFLMQMESQCLFFTYHVTLNQCYLKAGLGTSTSLEPYYISGPKYCGFSSGKS